MADNMTRWKWVDEIPDDYRCFQLADRFKEILVVSKGGSFEEHFVEIEIGEFWPLCM